MKKKEGEHSILERWRRSKGDKPIRPEILPVPQDTLVHPTREQQRIWILQQLYPEDPFYNYAYVLEFEGQLDHDALKKALIRIFDEQSVLRSYYPSKNGIPSLEVAEQMELPFDEIDLGDEINTQDEQLRVLLNQLANTVFDLETGPLMSIVLIRLDQDKHILFFNFHHIIIDEWSIKILKRNLAEYYLHFSGLQHAAATAILNFRDYAFWSHTHESFDELLPFWRDYLSGDIPHLDLGMGGNRPLKSFTRGANSRRAFSADLSERALKLSEKMGITPFVFFLGLCKMLLYRYSQQEDICVGTPLSMRDETALEDVMGFFLNTLVVRSNLQPELPFSSFVDQINSSWLEILEHKDIPFDVLVKDLNPERGPDRHPFFRVMFLYFSISGMPSFGSDLELVQSYEYHLGRSKFDLTFAFEENDGAISSLIEYNPDVFSEEEIERLQDHAVTLLDSVVSNPSGPLSSLPILTESEKDQAILKDSTLGKELANYNGIHEVILARASEAPDSVAVSDGKNDMTYQELVSRAIVIASEIRKREIAKNSIIGLCMDSSPDVITALLGILMSGCAYLPLDPTYPKDRLAYMCEHARIDLIVSRSSDRAVLDGFSQELLLLEDLDSSNGMDKPIPTSKTDLAYVIYTSGSSGRPKAVAVTHGNILNSTQGRLTYYDADPTTFLLLSSISFDSSKAGIFWTLCTGGILVVPPRGIEQRVAELGELIQSSRITHTLLLPSLYRTLLDVIPMQQISVLRHVIVAGEACPEPLVEAHFDILPGVRLYNEYGPTECTVWCLAHEFKAGEKMVSIGRPVAGSHIYLLNSAQQLVPFGGVGEIYVGGQNVVDGYFKSNGQSQERFIKNPFDNDIHPVLYRTGDLGRCFPDGSVQHIGRADDQVKIRGFRVELEEINSIILGSGMLKESQVLWDKEQNILRSALKCDKEINLAEVRSFLQEKLPDYMVPSQLFQIDEWPRLPNGKVNRKELLGVLRDHHKTEERAEFNSTNPLSIALHAIWKELLEIEDISDDDDYFELGGDSLNAIRLFWNIEKHLGFKLSPNVLFEHTTIRALTDYMEKQKADRNELQRCLIPIKPTGSQTPLFCVHGGEGHVLFYKDLPRYISQDRPMYIIQPQGIEGDQDMHESMEEMARTYIEEMQTIQVDGTYNVSFYCYSALAVEIAKQLQELGHEANLIIVDSSTPPLPSYHRQGNRYRFQNYFRRLSSNPFITLRNSVRYRYRKYIEKKVLQIRKDEVREQLIRVREQLNKVYDRYQWEPIDAPCTLILTHIENNQLKQQKIERWNYWCTSDVQIFYNSGDHFSIFEEPHVQSLGPIIESACN